MLNAKIFEILDKNALMLSILLFKGLPVFEPDFFFIPKYPYPLGLSRDKTKG